MYKDILSFIWQNKKWWLIPPIIIFLLFGLLVAFSTTSPINPFIYMLF
jgi:hypothetical protein